MVQSYKASIDMTMDEEQRKRAVTRFEKNGCFVKFGQYIDDCVLESRSSIKNRVEDLHNALEDKDTGYIIAGSGGFHVNELLDHLDYDLIKKASKPIIGFSDITTLQNAVFAKTGLVSYTGPNFSLFGMDKGFDYIESHFFENLKQDSFSYMPSDKWSDDEWYFDQEKREFLDNNGPLVISSGDASGILLGGNISSLALLQGTEYMPNIENSVLLAEEDAAASDSTLNIMIRQLRGVINSGGKPKAILLGRFQKTSEIDNHEITEAMKINFGDLNIPIIANIDFGHTTPFFTFPIGAEVNIKADINNNNYEINIMKG